MREVAKNGALSRGFGASGFGAARLCDSPASVISRLAIGGGGIALSSGGAFQASAGQQAPYVASKPSKGGGPVEEDLNMLTASLDAEDRARTQNLELQESAQRAQRMQVAGNVMTGFATLWGSACPAQTADAATMPAVPGMTPEQYAMLLAQQQQQNAGPSTTVLVVGGLVLLGGLYFVFGRD